MKKSTSEQLPIDTQVNDLDKRIKICKKFIDLTSYSSITIIFAGKYQGIETTELVKIDNPDFAIVPVKELFDFFNAYAQNLLAKKMFLKEGIPNETADSFLKGTEALKSFQASAKKNFGE